MNTLDKLVQGFLDTHEIAQGILWVRQDDQIIYQNRWGYAHVEKQEKVTEDAIFRLMSMTKCVTAVAVLKLIDEGKIHLDDPLALYLPAFQNLRVVCDSRYPSYPQKPSILRMLNAFLWFNPNNIKTKPTQRLVTIRDLLSHSSGIEQGMVGLIRLLKNKHIYSTNEEKIDEYASFPLDFEPGEGTGYSPLAAFDILIKVIEIASHRKAEDYFKEFLFQPLDMTHTFFYPSEEDQEKIVQNYEKKGNRLLNVTHQKQDIDGVLKRRFPYVSGSGGLYSTMTDLDHFISMLLADGVFRGKPFLKKETVQLMRSELPRKHLEPEPGNVWGAGVKIRQTPSLQKSPVTEGSYGWSGAFGTHFVISPKDRLSMVWLTNLTNAGGASSKVSKAIEECVFETFVLKK